LSRTTREPNTGGREGRRGGGKRVAGHGVIRRRGGWRCPLAGCHPAAGGWRRALAGAFHLGQDCADALADDRSPELPLSELGEGSLEEVLDDALAGDCSWLPPLSDSKT